MQVLLGVAVMFTVTWAQMELMPFSTLSMNLFELMSNWLSLMTFFLGVFTMDYGEGEDISIAVDGASACVMVLNIIYLCVTIAMGYYLTFDIKKRAKIREILLQLQQGNYKQPEKDKAAQSVVKAGKGKNFSGAGQEIEMANVVLSLTDTADEADTFVSPTATLIAPETSKDHKLELSEAVKVVELVSVNNQETETPLTSEVAEVKETDIAKEGTKKVGLPDAENPNLWAVRFDKKSGRNYYVNKTTKTRTWKKPACLNSERPEAQTVEASSPSVVEQAPMKGKVGDVSKEIQMENTSGATVAQVEGPEQDTHVPVELIEVTASEKPAAVELVSVDHTKDEAASPSSNSSMSPKEVVEEAKVLVIAKGPRQAKDPSQMSFAKGDIVEVTDSSGQWHLGILHQSSTYPITGEIKKFAPSFFKPYIAPTQTEVSPVGAMLVAKWDREAKRADQMSFCKNDVLEVVKGSGDWHVGILRKSTTYPVNGTALKYPPKYFRSQRASDKRKDSRLAAVDISTSWMSPRASPSKTEDTDSALKPGDMVMAILSRETKTADQLSFEKGDIIEVVKAYGTRWHSGILRKSNKYPITGKVMKYRVNFVKAVDSEEC